MECAGYCQPIRSLLNEEHDRALETKVAAVEVLNPLSAQARFRMHIVIRYC